MPTMDVRYMLRDGAGTLDSGETDDGDWVHIGDGPYHNNLITIHFPYDSLRPGHYITITIQQADDSSGTNAELVPHGSPLGIIGDDDGPCPATWTYRLFNTRPYLRYQITACDGDWPDILIGISEGDIPHMAPIYVSLGIWVAAGDGTNTLAWSEDGKVWTGLGTTIFSGQGFGVAYNGSIWVATGYGTNTLAWSTDGKNWTGLGKGTFSPTGFAVAWNGSLFVAVGQGTNTIAWSTDGKVWTGLGTGTFARAGTGIAWNGTLWVAVGYRYGGANTIAWSTDGKVWTGLGTGTFDFSGWALAWNGTLWVAVGDEINTIAWSTDGKTWTGLGNAIFSVTGYGVASSLAPCLYPPV